MTLTGFIVELDTTERPEGYHDCMIIAMPSDPPSLTIWVSYMSFCVCSCNLCIHVVRLL